MEATCLFCLEPIQDNPAQNPIGCSCKILLHPQCLEQWWTQKQQLECPVCHTVAVPNPQINESVRVVYVAMNPEETTGITPSQQKCVGFCCLGFLFWSIALSILSWVFEK
jgi:hypothetical protein